MLRCWIGASPSRGSFPGRLRPMQGAVRKRRLRSARKGSGRVVQASACNGGELGFIKISQVARSFGSMSCTASAVQQSRRFGVVNGNEQAAFRRGSLGARSLFGQLISNLLVYSAWNNRFGGWKGMRHANRFGGPCGRTENKLEISVCSVGASVLRYRICNLGITAVGRVPEEWQNLCGATFRRGTSEVHGGFGS